MSQVIKDIVRYFLIFLIGAAIEYTLLIKGIVPENIILKVIAPAWGNTLVILTGFKILSFLMHIWTGDIAND